MEMGAFFSVVLECHKAFDYDPLLALSITFSFFLPEALRTGKKLTFPNITHLPQSVQGAGK